MWKELLSRISDEAMLLSSLSNYVKAFWYRVGELATLGPQVQSVDLQTTIAGRVDAI